MPTVEVYWILALISSVILGIIVLLNIFGFDIDDFDADFGGDLFSFNSLVAFVCVGSWTGYLGLSTTSMQDWVILIISIAVGLVAYVGSIWILKKMKNLESSGNLDFENAVGSTGKVYLSIPANKSGKGQIQVVLQGRLVTISAMTGGEKLETGDPVIIYDVEGSIVLVELFNEE